MPDLPIKDAKPFQPILKKSSSLPKIGRKKGKRAKKKSIKIVDSKPKIEEPKRKEESSKIVEYSFGRDTLIHKITITKTKNVHILIIEH